MVWFTAEQQPGLKDFWYVYDAHYDNLIPEALRVERARSVHQQKEPNAPRELLRRAIAGDWEPYESELRRQGSVYAKSGISFSAWFETVREATRHLLPILVKTYGKEPAQLTAALVCMQQFLDRMTTIAGDSFIESRHGLIVEQEAEKSAIFDAALDSIVTMNHAGVITDCNLATQKAFGYERAEVIGQSFEALVIPPSMNPRYGDVLKQYLAGGEASIAGERMELTAKRKDASVFPVELTISGLRSNSVPMFTGFIHDLSRRKQAEEALRKSEEQYRQVVETTTDGVWKTDANSLTVFVNRRFAAMLGYEVIEMIGKPARDFFDDPSAFIVAAEAKRIDADDIAAADVELRKRDATALWVNLASTPLFDPAGNFVGRLAVLRDVTDRRKITAQLMISDRMASVGTLAAGVAHEINNPLSVVITNLEFITKDLDEATAANGAQVASTSGRLAWLRNQILAPLADSREAAERIRLIVRDLKFFSRNNDDSDSAKAIDINAVMESSLKMAWNEIRHRARLVKNLGKIPAFECNGSRLGQVFLNLITNAAQSIAEGHVDENEIRITTKLDALARIVVEVSDTGSGMDAKSLVHVFDAFYTTKPLSEGMGLGLSICHRIIAQLGGEITVESERGKGSTFRITLPASAAIAESVNIEPSLPASVLGRQRIMVVDDEILFGRATMRLLGSDQDVVVMSSAGEALTVLAKSDPFDIILCDLMMPQMTGMELHAELKQLAPEQANRMIFMTGGAFTPQARTFLLDVKNERLEKPFTQQALCAAINRLTGAAPHPPPIVEIPTSTKAKSRLLIVDDDEAALRAITRTLTEIGYIVETAGTGELAAQMLMKDVFDLVIIDIKMPGMNGIELLLAVRRIDLDVSVVLITGDPQIATAVKAVEYGAMRYLLKPIDSHELERTVAYAVRMSKMARTKREALRLLGNVHKFVGDRAGLAARFANALDTLWMAYQPIISQSKNNIYGYEALVRNGEPTLADPTALLSAAEELGRLVDLGRAIRQNIAMSAGRLEGARLFVNLHALDLNDEELFSANAPLSRFASNIVLEITERASLDKVDGIEARLAKLRATGYHIALDDLGAGYAGLTSLAQLQPEVVKLDMSLIRGVDVNVTKQRLIRTMACLANEMNMDVIVEGVETVGERDALLKLNCDLFQGYLYAKPGRPFPLVVWPS